MKSIFEEYFEPSEEIFTELWENAQFAFDASFLLNLYRYSEDTRKDLYKIIDKLSERIWLPNQTVREFLNNRLEVINKQKLSYEDALKDIRKIKDKFKSPRQHPFIKETIHKALNKVFEEAEKDLGKNRDAYSDMMGRSDHITDVIADLFKDKIGGPYNQDRLNEICEEGEKRYKESVPPGYKDEEKEENKYGDLVLWYQIMDYSESSKEDIVFVTDEGKEDWWWKFDRNTIGPRSELIAEFKNKTKKRFYMYHSGLFMKYAEKYLDEKVNRKTIKEIEEIRKKEEEQAKGPEDFWNRYLAEHPEQLSHGEGSILGLLKSPHGRWPKHLQQTGHDCLTGEALKKFLCQSYDYLIKNKEAPPVLDDVKKGYDEEEADETPEDDLTMEDENNEE
jgi:hypothetical protein